MGTPARFRARRHGAGPEIAAATVGVGFDIDHTLLIDNKLERIAFLRLLERVVSKGGHYLGTLEEETQRIDALLTSQRGGACTIESAVESFVRERGALPGHDDVEWYKAMALAMADDILIPLPGARDMLAALRGRGVATAILTNGWNPLQLRKAHRVSFEGPIIASADIGAQKPDARAFHALAEALELPPNRIWYVGDDPLLDVTGAMNAGLNAIWLDAENKTYPPTASPPAHTIHALHDILAIAIP